MNRNWNSGQKSSLNRKIVFHDFFSNICQNNKIFREINSHSKFHIVVYLYYISGKVAFIDEVDHCTECHTCYEYQSKQCGKCGSSWAQFCPKCNNTSRTMCEICGLDVSSWDSWTHSIEDCSVHSISQLDIQVKILHFFSVKMQENLIVIITNKRKATCNFYLFIYLFRKPMILNLN